MEEELTFEELVDFQNQFNPYEIENQEKQVEQQQTMQENLKNQLLEQEKQQQIHLSEQIQQATRLEKLITARFIQSIAQDEDFKKFQSEQPTNTIIDYLNQLKQNDPTNEKLTQNLQEDILQIEKTFGNENLIEQSQTYIEQYNKEQIQNQQQKQEQKQQETKSQQQVEKLLASQMILELNDTSFKEWQKENTELSPLDYLEREIYLQLEIQKNDLLKQNEKQKAEEINIVQEQIKQRVDFVKSNFPDTKKQELTNQAEKIVAKHYIKDISQSQGYQEFKEKNGKDVNPLDYLKKQLTSPYLNQEQVQKLEKQIELISKTHPELKRDAIAEEQKAQEQKQSILSKAIAQELEKNSNLHSNGERIGEELLEMLLLPIKIAKEVAKQNKQLKQQELQNRPNIEMYSMVNQQLYKVESYSIDFSKIYLKHTETQKTITIDNNKPLKLMLKNDVPLNNLQRELLSNGKNLIINQNTGQPIIVSENQGKLTYTTVDLKTFKNNIQQKQEKTKNIAQKAKKVFGMKM